MKTLLSALIAVSLVVTSCGDDDEQGSDGVPVAADEAQIEVTFTGDGTSFVGDREITEGVVTVTFSNETDDTATMAVLEYETGSAALAEELEIVEEGGSVVTGDAPTEGYSEVDYEAIGEYVPPGIYTWTMELEPGNTYLFDVGPEGFHTKGLWRMAVIEVVAE